jgi:hypothetical protein
MKRPIVIIGVIIFLGVTLLTGTLFAQKKKPDQSTKPLPDFTITRLFLTNKCRVGVEVKNLGPGNVPDQVWSSHTSKSPGVYLYRNGKKWGGATIWKFDSAKRLKAPGGAATYVSDLKVSDSEKIKAVVDGGNVVAESNNGNNAFTKRFACGSPSAPLEKPDLIIESIELVKHDMGGDCFVKVVVKNIGPGPVPDFVYTDHNPKSAGVYLFRGATRWGGAAIWQFDPWRNLQPPGGKAVYTSTLKVSGAVTIQAVVDAWGKVKETNNNNNSRNRTFGQGDCEATLSDAERMM